MSIESSTSLEVAVKPTFFPFLWLGRSPIMQLAPSTRPQGLKELISSDNEENVELMMPSDWPDKLITFMTSVMTVGTNYNCHRFTRHMLGLDSTEGDTTPILESVKDLNPTTSLRAGELGLIGVQNDPQYTHQVWHSLLGYNEKTRESLQVTEFCGDLVIATTDDVVDFHREKYSHSAQLFAVPTDQLVAEK